MLLPYDLVHLVDEVAQMVVEASLMTGVDLPDNIVTPVGGIVYDCEMVAVSVSEVLPGAFEGSPVLAGCGPDGYRVTFEIAIVRTTCALPKGINGDLPPDQSDYHKDLESVTQDTSVLATAMESMLIEKGTGTYSIALGEPSGGMIGVVATGTFPIWPKD